MATTVHIREELLRRIDERAKQLGLSRNRYVVRALEKALDEETTWSQEFLTMLSAAASDTGTHELVEEMQKTIDSSKRSKSKPPEL